MSTKDLKGLFIGWYIFDVILKAILIVWAGYRMVGYFRNNDTGWACAWLALIIIHSLLLIIDTYNFTDGIAKLKVLEE